VLANVVLERVRDLCFSRLPFGKSREAISVAAEPGPNFICIGMPKTGTGWLFDQLKFHSDFWVPPIKGMYYLDRPITQSDDARELLRILGDRERLKIRTANLRPLDESDVSFLNLLNSYSGKPRDLERYAALFQFGAGRIAGDITPGYARLDEQIIKAIAGRFPNLRVIILLRDPVERVWSQVSMLHRKGKFPPAILKDESAFRSFLCNDKEVADFAYASKIVRKWSTCAPRVKFEHFFFDDLIENPLATRARIISFLCGNPEKPSGELAADCNRKARYKRLLLSDEAKSLIVNQMSDELYECSVLFGGVATKWLNRYLH